MLGKLLLCFLVLNLVSVESDPDLTFSIHCEEHRLVGQWDMSKDETREVLVTLVDTMCNSTNMSTNINGSPRSFTITDNNTNTTTMNITTMFSECNTTIEESTTSVIVKNTALLKVTNTTTILSEYYHYEINCKLPRDIFLSTGDNYHNFSDTIFASREFNASKFFAVSISIDFYQEDTFSTKHESSPITVNSNDDIFVGIKETNTNPHFKFIVSQCYASDRSAANSGLSDVFFDNKCSLDGTFSIKSAENSNDSFNFAIRAFDFIEDEKSVYLHCKIYVCFTESTGANCVQTCDATGARWKRDIQGAESPLQEIVITSPKIVFNSERTCYKKNCPKNSNCFELEPAVCLCKTGYVFSQITRECISERIIVIKKVFLDLPWDPAYEISSSKEYRKFVVRYEDLLYRLFLATFSHYQIEGIKIINLSKGGVILDVAIIYTASSTDEIAYFSFLNSLRTNYVKATRVLQHIKFVEVNQPLWESKTTRVRKRIPEMRYWIIGGGALIALLIIAVTVIYATRKKKTGEMKTVHNFDNKGMECKEP